MERDRKNKNRILFSILGIGTGLLLAGCSIKESEPSVIGELAYDVSKKHGFTIHIKEGNQYIPYLVLTNDYNGNTLLLRKEALAQEISFGYDRVDDNDYYAESFVDFYLNSEYYDVFSDNMKETIVESTIKITKDYPDIFEVEDIKRKIFLLSCREVNINVSITNNDGNGLKYFKLKEHMRCQRNGKYCGWWLRTKYVPESSLVWYISCEGVSGGNGVQYSGGVRPAFCVPSSAKVEKQQITSNVEGYVLSIEE